MRTNGTQYKLPHHVVVKAPGLLPMLYNVSELVEELEITETTLRSWISKGAPSQRDERGHVWINGEALAAWLAAHTRQKRTRRLKDDEGYCFRCRGVVRLRNPEIIPGKGKQIYIRGTCEVCGATINRGGRIDKSF